jgi:hypothetical protein
MPMYVYGCDDKSHARLNIPHGMSDDPEILCPKCNGIMHRVPQAVMHYNNPHDSLVNELDKQFCKRKAEGFRGRPAG